MSTYATLMRIKDRLERRDKAFRHLVAELRLEQETLPKDSPKREALSTVIRRISAIINNE